MVLRHTVHLSLHAASPLIPAVGKVKPAEVAATVFEVDEVDGAAVPVQRMLLASRSLCTNMVGLGCQQQAWAWLSAPLGPKPSSDPPTQSSTGTDHKPKSQFTELHWD